MGSGERESGAMMETKSQLWCQPLVTLWAVYPKSQKPALENSELSTCSGRLGSKAEGGSGLESEAPANPGDEVIHCHNPRPLSLLTLS